MGENRYRTATAEELAQYDEVVREYYQNRSKLDLTWTQQIRNNLCGEVRPSVLPYLQEQGFAKK